MEVIFYHLYKYIYTNIIILPKLKSYDIFNKKYQESKKRMNLSYFLTFFFVDKHYLLFSLLLIANIHRARIGVFFIQERRKTIFCSFTFRSEYLIFFFFFFRGSEKYIALEYFKSMKYVVRSMKSIDVDYSFTVFKEWKFLV